MCIATPIAKSGVYNSRATSYAGYDIVDVTPPCPFRPWRWWCVIRTRRWISWIRWENGGGVVKRKAGTGGMCSGEGKDSRRLQLIDVFDV
jgi:hypothetical protein